MAFSYKVDTASKRFFVIEGAVIGAILLVGIIISAVAPNAKQVITESAYDCPNNSKIWSDSCRGVKVSETKAADFFFKDMSPLNRFFTASMTPYTLKEGANGFLISQKLEVTVFGGNSKEETTQQIGSKIIAKMEREYDSGKCSSVILAANTNIVYRAYRIHLDFPDIKPDDIGEIVFRGVIGTYEYGVYEICLTVVFLCVCIAEIGTWLWLNKFAAWKNPFTKLSLALIVAVFFFTNPLLSVKYIVGAEWFFNIIDGMFKDVFLTTFFFFVFFGFSLLMDENVQALKGIESAVKIIAPGTYFVLSFVSHIWTNVIYKDTPVVVSSDGFIGIRSLLFLLGVTYVTNICIFLFELYKSMAIIKTVTMYKVRFIYVIIPIVVIFIAQLITIFASAISLFNKSAFQVGMMLFIYHCFIWMIIIGYPAKSTSNINENMHLTENKFTGFNEEDYDEEETKQFISNLKLDE